MAQGTGPGRSRSVRAEVARFAVAGLVTLLLVAVGSVLASRRSGTAEAIDDARNTTALLARTVVRPALTPEVLAGTDDALSDLDEVVQSRVLDHSLVRVKIWDRSGRIVYSDEPRLVGSAYPLSAEDLEAFESGSVDAEVTDLGLPENRFERGEQLLEVYLPITGPDGELLLFEAYYRYDAVVDAGWTSWLTFAPVILGGLLALELVLLPLAWRMARRVEQRDLEREALLQRAIEASDAERRRIASDLHDGVVQSLAGVSFTLGAAASRVSDSDPALATELKEAATETRDGVRALRSLLVEIYPPNLHSAGLRTALTDLASSFAPRGLDVDVEFDADLGDAPAVEALAFRTAQEALRNVVRHADARHARVVVQAVEGFVDLTVDDDGRGFPDGQLQTSADGHFGLRVLRDLVGEAGGTLELGTSTMGGVRVAMRVPRP